MEFAYDLINTFCKPRTTDCYICKKKLSNEDDYFNTYSIINQIEEENFLYFSTYGIIVNHIYKSNVPSDFKDLLYGYLSREPFSYSREKENKFCNSMINLCNDCFRKNLNEFKKRYNSAYLNMNTVQTYPANYSGTFKLNSAVKPQIITYKMEKSKNQTINKIKFMASFHRCNIVYNVTYDYDENKCTGVYAIKGK